MSGLREEFRPEDEAARFREPAGGGRDETISKSFSSTSIMQLVAAKKLNLDDDFSKLIGFQIRNPHFPDKVITLKMIMSHTSSLNDDQGYFNLDIVNPAKNKEWQKCHCLGLEFQ